MSNGQFFLNNEKNALDKKFIYLWRPATYIVVDHDFQG